MPDNAVANAAVAGAAAAAAGAAAAPGPGQPGQQQRQQQGGLGSILGMIVRMGVMWYFMNAMKGNKTPPPQQQGAQGQQGPGQVAGGYVYPAFERGSPVDMYMFLSEREPYPGPPGACHEFVLLGQMGGMPLRSIETASGDVMKGGGGELEGSERQRVDGRTDLSQRIDTSELIWSETDVRLGEKTEQRKDTYVYKPSDAVKNNGSVYIQMVLARAGAPILFNELGYDPTDLAYYQFQLNTHRPRPRNSTGVNLLSDNPVDAPKVEKDVPREIINFLRPNITLQLVDHYQAYDKSRIPQQLEGHLRLNAAGNYVPIVFFNDFWLLRDKLVPVNETLDNVTLHLELSYVSMTWWQLLLQMDQSFGMQVRMGLAQDGESDEMKRIFLEGNPILLYLYHRQELFCVQRPALHAAGLTFVVSLLHTVFDLLAFKNDIGFWKNNKSMEGLSARTVLINAFCQVVILLYLFDNDTSFVVLLSSVLGTGIELWKVTKAFDVSFNRQRFPYIILKDRATYSNKQTKQYDAEAMRYLSYALYPLVIGYSIYSLMYKTHKSWYSWVLSSLVGAVYMFGFILMCPQLYLNYKLKSVAHLPWRQLTYKFLNTIIDDLFAFVIKMPLLHRLSVFRDDVVFLVYLYQRWVYRVDKTRANEFGWSEEQPAAEAEAEAERSDAPALPAPASADADAAVGSSGAAASAGADADKAGKGEGSRKRKGGKEAGKKQEVSSDKDKEGADSDDKKAR
ncbi:hypothetical protein VOLCADRAFT_106719 [Volvox carteri f. nagariensis]|uniref:Uncharacterized protein n=1 Tax=Volvox carteri f. nagariensis TaxID=3068 RepID=D8U9A1_VOLCA|nr:uncharacterized protein VOLCADRAFT_106719 [Volvox carteri f. nagariensis]EFJ43770.1 hypothetical protein VOLCADRAFT_106719 [Volvox carteri f. nagariensis]|eukprot:XP_002955251.1 hypothetical protein VOLCADRAFT_106719 [Volvox carteri f. nagariensis]